MLEPYLTYVHIFSTIRHELLEVHMELRQLTNALYKISRMSTYEYNEKAPRLKDHLHQLMDIKPSDTRDTNPSPQDVAQQLIYVFRNIEDDPKAVKEVLALQD